LIYVWICPVCEERHESRSRRVEDQPIHEHFNRAVIARRDFQSEGVQVDRFAFRVGGNRRARSEPMPYEEARRHNEEKLNS